MNYQILSADTQQPQGPYPATQLIAWWRSGKIGPDTMIWREGMSDWEILENYAQEIGLPARMAAPRSPSTPTPPPAPGRGARLSNAHIFALQQSDCSRGIYIGLAVFLGLLGIHNFYAGYAGRGIIQILLTITMFGAFLTAVWCLIEICSTTHDAKGRKMK